MTRTVNDTNSALRALSSLRGLSGAPEVPPLCRETQSLGQQILNAPVGINGLKTQPMYAGSVSERSFHELQFHQAAIRCGQKGIPNTASHLHACVYTEKLQ